MSESPYNYVESIRPKNSAIMPLDSKILTEREVMSYADAPKTEQPYYNDILEIRVRYYREADGKAFGGRKFFSRTQEKEWARENQSSFPTEILAAALKWPSRDFRPFFDLNPLELEHNPVGEFLSVYVRWAWRHPEPRMMRRW